MWQTAQITFLSIWFRIFKILQNLKQCGQSYLIMNVITLLHSTESEAEREKIIMRPDFNNVIYNPRACVTIWIDNIRTDCHNITAEIGF